MEPALGTRDEPTRSRVAPTLEVVSPTDGVLWPFEQPLLLVTNVEDDQGPAGVSIQWESDLQGVLGALAASTRQVTLRTQLRPGSHTLSVRAIDRHGLTTIVTRTVHVGTAPVLRWTAPRDRHRVHINTPFSASALVAEASPSAVIQWSSDLEGWLRDQPVDRAELTTELELAVTGAHTLTAEVRDEAGWSAEQTLLVSVEEPPTHPEVRLLPLSPSTTDNLRVDLLLPATDPDSINLTYSYAWFLDGIPTTLSGPTLDADQTHRGQRWSVEVRAHDQAGPGPAASAEVVVGNAPPSVGKPVVLPAEPVAGTAMRCSASGLDPDGDRVTLAIHWSVDGQLAGTGPLFVAQRRGELIDCQATPSDGTLTGTSNTSDPVLVTNTPPVLQSAEVRVQPSRGPAELMCLPGITHDPDSDLVSLTHRWEVAGRVVGRKPWLRAQLDPGTEVRCITTPHDGVDAGLPVEASLFVTGDDVMNSFGEGADATGDVVRLDEGTPVGQVLTLPRPAEIHRVALDLEGRGCTSCSALLRGPSGHTALVAEGTCGEPGIHHLSTDPTQLAAGSYELQLSLSGCVSGGAELIADAQQLTRTCDPLRCSTAPQLAVWLEGY